MIQITRDEGVYTNKKRSDHNKLYTKMVTKLLSNLDRELNKWLREWLSQEQIIVRTIPVLEETVFRSWVWPWSDIFNEFKETKSVSSFKKLISFFNPEEEVNI